MKKLMAFCVTVLIVGSYALSQDQPGAPEKAPLLLVQEIPLPNVGGRIDHFTFDAKRKRVIGAALGNNTVEVVDTFAGRDIQSITGASDPQGVVYVGELDKLFVANGTDGKLRIYDGDSFKLLNAVDIGEDADNVRYDPAEKKVYVAYGGDEEGGIAVIDAASGKRLEDAAKLDAHPESFQITTSRPVIYANIATKAKVVVIDRKTHKVTEWPLKNLKANYPMALDEADHRIFVVTRKPAQLVVLDSESGAMVASVPCVNDADDLYYDAGRKRIYIPGGEGFISVIQQTDADHYQFLAKIPTTIGARTGLWYEKRDRFYLAGPSTYRGYSLMWSDYLKIRCEAAWMREVKTHQVQSWLEEIGREHRISKTTLKHVKNFLSGVFRHAAQQGYFDGASPVKLAEIPAFAPSGAETKPYSLEEIAAMLKVLSEPSATAVATAAFTGLRLGELRGLTWESYEPAQEKDSLGWLNVTRSVWRNTIGDPKTAKSKAPVPVIPQLAKRLDVHRRECGNALTGPIFANSAGHPLDLNACYQREMKDVLKRTGITWHGWHGFRRGLASNLNRLGVDDSVIQRILRHSNVATTQNHYIKTASPDAIAAMKQFSEALMCSACAPDGSLRSQGTVQ